MTATNERKSRGRLLGQIVPIVLIVSVVSVVLDWYRTLNLPIEEPPPLRALMDNGQYVDVIEKSHEEPVVIYFWAVWCPACSFVSPSVNWVSDHYTVVAVSGSSGNNHRVEQFMRAKDYQFNNINDPKSKIMQDWKISVTPTIYILKDGEIDSVTTGISTPMGILARIWLAS